MRRGLLWGTAAAVAYVATGVFSMSTGRPVLPVFDGLAPPVPYRWVSPPPEAEPGNLPPAPGRDTIDVGANPGVFGATTDDGQAHVTLPAEFVELPEEVEAIRVSLTPLDPEMLGPPPDGMRFDGNAYRVTATYVPSGDPVVLTGDATVLLRYSTHATAMVRLVGDRWTRMETTVVGGTLQLFANTPELGVFAPIGPEIEGQGPAWPLWVGLGAGGLAVAVAAGVFLRRRSATARGAKRKPTRSRGKKGKARTRR